MRDEDVRSVAWANIGHFTLRRFPFYFSLFGNDSDADCLVVLRGFKLCSDWLCVVRNRKWVAMTNTMMTQRLFRNVFFFIFFLYNYFFFFLNKSYCFNTQVDFGKVCHRRRVWLLTAECMMSWWWQWWCHNFVWPLTKQVPVVTLAVGDGFSL